MATGMFVTVIAPVPLVTARTEPLAMVAPLAMTRRPVPDGVVVADDVVVDAAVVLELVIGGFAARVGLGVIDDESVGVSVAVLAAAVVVPVVAVVAGPAANWPGVAFSAAVVGVTNDALLAPVTAAGTVAGAPTNVAAPSPFVPLVMTGVGGELIDALTVAIGVTYCDGGTI